MVYFFNRSGHFYNFVIQIRFNKIPTFRTRLKKRKNETLETVSLKKYIKKLLCPYRSPKSPDPKKKKISEFPPNPRLRSD